MIDAKDLREKIRIMKPKEKLIRALGASYELGYYASVQDILDVVNELE